MCTPICVYLCVLLLILIAKPHIDVCVLFVYFSGSIVCTISDVYVLLVICVHFRYCSVVHCIHKK